MSKAHLCDGGLDLAVSIWAKSLFALAALAAFFQGHAIYYLLYALAGAYLAHRIAVVRALKRLSIARSQPKLRLFPGERMRVELTVKNQSRAPLPWVRLTDRVEQGLAPVTERSFGFALPPGGEARLAYEVEATKRGRSHLGPVAIQTGDPLGIERFDAAGTERAEVIVYPRIHPVERLGIPAKMHVGSFRAAERHLFDPSRVIGVRGYMEGDSLRHVHWRATAHTGEFMVKKFEPAGAFDLAVVLDLAADHYASWNAGRMSELAVETAASLLAAAAARRQAFALYAHCAHEAAGRETPFLFSGHSKGEGHLEACLEALALARLTERPFDVENLVIHAATTLRRETSLAWVAPRIDAATAEGLARLHRAGFRVLVVHVSSEGSDLPIPPGVGYARVSYGADIASL